MKLIVQIPCYNEEHTLPLVLERIPRSIPGVDRVEVLIIDDGSTDRTAEVARHLGAEHVLTLDRQNRRWLGRAFRTGIDHALRLGADIVVNTDGDNQYPSELIPEIIRPIVEKRCDIVIGDRNPGAWTEFSEGKRRLQRVGNWTISTLLGAEVRDAVSGFRAYSRRALLELHVITDFSYTIDTLIQASKKGIDIQWIPISPNRKTRESHLEPRTSRMATRGAQAIVRLVTVYDPFRTFLAAALVFFVPAAIALGRFLYFFFFDHQEAAGHIQSVIVGGTFLVIAALLSVFGVIAGLLGVNRRLIEEILTRVRTLELALLKAAPSDSQPLADRISVSRGNGVTVGASTRPGESKTGDPGPSPGKAAQYSGIGRTQGDR